MRSFCYLLMTMACFSCNAPSASSDKDIARINLCTEPPCLDSRRTVDTTSITVQTNLFEGLTRLDERGEPKPALAKKIDISDDRLTYTFHLRESYWSDGTPLVAHDFVAAWSSCLEPTYPAQFAYKLFMIEHAKEIKEGKLPVEALGVSVIDEHTLEVKLNHPTPYFLEVAALSPFLPIPHEKMCETWAMELDDNFVCNGPFQLTKWEHENEIVMQKNPLYWEAESVLLDEVRMLMVEDVTTELYMYEMDELDWAGSPISAIPEEFITALKDKGVLQQKASTGIYTYKLNTDCPLLSHPKIRQALARAINREAIVEHILQAGQVPALSLVPHLPGKHEVLAHFEDNDPKRAAQLFAEGLAELGIDTCPKLTLSMNTNKQHIKIAQAVQQQWKERLGLSIDLENCDWKVYLSKVNHQDYEVARSGWLGDFQDPLSYLDPYRTNKRGGNNETGWENPRYRELLELSEKEVNPTLRMQYLSEAETLLMGEMPVIPLFYITFNYLKKDHLKDVILSHHGLLDFKHARIER